MRVICAIDGVCTWPFVPDDELPHCPSSARFSFLQLSFMLDNLFAPPVSSLSLIRTLSLVVGDPYHRLGKKLPSSGKVVLNSRSALTLHVKAQIPTIIVAMTAVLAFHLAGCAYQPPAGDQTCLG